MFNKIKSTFKRITKSINKHIRGFVETMKDVIDDRIAEKEERAIAVCECVKEIGIGLKNEVLHDKEGRDSIGKIIFPIGLGIAGVGLFMQDKEQLHFNRPNFKKNNLSIAGLTVTVAGLALGGTLLFLSQIE